MTDISEPAPLLRPGSVGDLTLPHRIVMAPMTRNRAGPGNAPREMNVVYYRQRAAAALILTEATPVEPGGHGYISIPGMYTDRQEEGWRRVVEAVHAESGRIFQQLWHAGRVGHPLNLPGDTAETVAPSAVRPEGEIPTPEGPRPYPEPRSLEADEIVELVKRFRDAARRARRAGFDGVELHAANGYLVDQSLRDGTNRREDGWGRGVEDRSRFLEEVTGALVDVWGPERVGSGSRPSIPSTTWRTPRPNGRFHTPRDGWATSTSPICTSWSRTPMREAFAGTIMLNGGYDRESGNRAVEEGRADLVSYAKLFPANPDLPRRFAEGLPPNELDPDTFYGGDEEGYIDYPTWEEATEEGNAAPATADRSAGR